MSKGQRQRKNKAEWNAKAAESRQNEAEKRKPTAEEIAAVEAEFKETDRQEKRIKLDHPPQHEKRRLPGPPVNIERVLRVKILCSTLLTIWLLKKNGMPN